MDTRKQLVAMAVVCLFMALMQTAASATTVKLAMQWSNTNAFYIGTAEAVKGFEAKYPDIKVEIQTSMSQDKVKLAIAAGDSPDVYFLANAITWGANGLIQPLDKYLQQAKLDVKSYVPAAFEQNIWKGKTWGVPIQVDPNFALVWNKAKLAEAGLPTEKGPVTIKDYDNYYKRLTIYNADQTPRQIGGVPWSVYGMMNTILTWTNIFGGNLYDQATRKVTAHNDRTVQALEYLKDYWTQYNPAYMELSKGLPTGQSRFVAGREAMTFIVAGDLSRVRTNFPDLSFGMGMLPVNPASGNSNPAWIGGFSLGIVTGGKEAEAGWKLIQYLTSDAEGVSLFSGASGYMPSYIKAPAFKKLGQDPYWKVWTDIAISSISHWPSIPSREYFQSQLNAVYPKTLDGTLVPRAAMEEVSRLVELEEQKYQ